MCIRVHTLLKVVAYYDLSVLSMSVMGFPKKKCFLSSFFGGIFRKILTLQNPLQTYFIQLL